MTPLAPRGRCLISLRAASGSGAMMLLSRGCAVALDGASHGRGIGLVLGLVIDRLADGENSAAR